MFAVRKTMAKVIKLGSNGYTLDETVRIAASSLRNGKVVAIPTDTIYGIAGLAQNEATVNEMYKIKGRDCQKPVSICVGCIEDIPKWGKVSFPKGILSDLLPGPVTLVMQRTSSLNSNLNPSMPTIGIRIPKDKFIQRLCLLFTEPLALTSANVSSSTSTLAVQEFKELWPHLDVVVDGGILGQCDPNRQGSTVVDLSVKGFYKVQRNGCALEKTVQVLKMYGLKEIN